MKYWLPYLALAAVIVALVAFVHTRELANTLIALAVLAALAISLGKPSGANTPSAR
jgi:hypothetical protein